MKKIKQIISIACVLTASLIHAQLSTTENYVYSKTYLDYNTSNVATKTAETVQYFDGLGRPKQVVNIKASPTGKDVVTPIEYDGFGRQVKDYLPVPQSNTLNGAIVPTPLANVTSTPYGQEKIYAEKTLENSPLDRLLEQKQVGTAWNDKPVKFEYGTNTSTEVKKYVTVTTFPDDITISKLVSATANYGANQLYKNTVTDEDGNKTVEFKNGKGQVVLVRKVVSATVNADTYYVYNEYNQLAFVIPPAAPATIDDTALNNFCYQYRYDGKGRLAEKKLPGKGWEHMVYDKADRLIFTQDDVLRQQGKWLFTKYDNVGRVIYTGIILAAPRASLQKTASNFVVTDSRDMVGFNKNGIQVYYTNILFNEIQTLLSVNYYDFYVVGDPFPTMVFDQTVLPSDVQQYGKSTKGLPLSSLVKNIEDDNWTKTYFYYDFKGRLIRQFAFNHLGGYHNTEKQLDFSGNQQQVITQHKRLATDTEKIIREKFTYDSQNRLIAHSHQVDSGPLEFLARNKYNELSQLEYKKVGGTVTDPLQQIDYKYNIRGWMTQINDPAALGSDLFGYKINYNQVEGLETPDALDATLKVKPKFNGNIAEVSWKTLTGQNEPLRRYGYVYDSLNRLTAGFYQGSNPSAKEYFEKVEYDLNGNISRLKRSQGITGGTTAGMIDNLKYDYLGNRLTKVTDEQQNPSGYPYVVSPTEIGYDLNGNMTNYRDKDIQKIIYNYLNLPSNIEKGTGKNRELTDYIYRADGVKVRKVFSGSVVTQTDYLDGFQYKDNILQFAPSAEGYYDFVKNKYIYNYTDHLGNVRLSYQKGTSGLEIIEENNYYPFGLKHEGYNGLAGNPAYQYKYLGKELQETGFYDLNARFYMPDAVVFGQHDPLSEKTLQPYAYSYNNPVRYGDPTGLSGNDFVQRKDGSIYWDKNATSQATTKAGETYLGKDLTFTFNSYIDPKLWDGPLGGFATGDKLTSTITVSSNTDADNNLLSIDIKSSEPIVHKTGGLIPNNDYFPGQQNVGLNIKGMKNGSATYEQHARVNGFDKLGIEAMGYSAPNVAQKLSIGLSGNNLSVTAATDVYPSAKLTVNSSQLFKYNQPSFKATFGKEFVGYRESRSYGNDAPIPVYRSLTPSPSFYTRYKK
ncbi:sugar-binding protein [Chryseobacterium sp. T16E-39]|uniref:DUF6443 domain-containing protein n=1 Tax=Chryseobacterium sp. T16E-39 TaxID=2015076 RepID=UPI000B5B27F5|nr:DUF6443 domain-containing protein [Chryseobacterium sp. T16E-39]ASK32521.1 sugar-binding protein [Chryseobacterium sp. T16E-39]